MVEAVNHLTVRSYLVEGEVVCCDERWLAAFDLLRRRRNEARAFLYGFDLLELNGIDMRREPIETRKATLRQPPAVTGISRPSRAVAAWARGCGVRNTAN